MRDLRPHSEHVVSPFLPDAGPCDTSLIAAGRASRLPGLQRSRRRRSGDRKRPASAGAPATRPALAAHRGGLPSENLLPLVRRHHDEL
jgi:hypothetical protein